MRTLLGLMGAALAVAVQGAETLVAQEAAGLPAELTEVTSEYVSRRNQALVEFNRVYLEKFAALETKFQEEKRPEAAKAMRNKVTQLKKEIERLRAASAGSFVILEAHYGSEEKSIDCLEPLLGEVREDRLRIRVDPRSIGLKKDPHFGVKKTFTVKYLWNDEVRTLSARDGQVIDVPAGDPK